MQLRLLTRLFVQPRGGSCFVLVGSNRRGKEDGMDPELDPAHYWRKGFCAVSSCSTEVRSHQKKDEVTLASVQSPVVPKKWN